MYCKHSRTRKQIYSVVQNGVCFILGNSDCPVRGAHYGDNIGKGYGIKRGPAALAIIKNQGWIPSYRMSSRVLRPHVD